MPGHITSLGHEEMAWDSNVLQVQPASQKKYKCPQCPSSFKRPENLKRHQRGHDENRRFTCHICDKSFARSDILGRHVAIHIPREQRDDNIHRRRACRECARVRERCSRGEPCRRCAIKALCCLYPEESRFKITMPHTRSCSEPEDYAATEVGSSGPDSTSGSLREVLWQDHGASQWQVEGFPASFREQSILSPSGPLHIGSSSYLASHHDAHFAPFLKYDALSPHDEGFYAGSASDSSTDDLRFITGDAELDGVSGLYNQASDIPPRLTSSLNRVGIYQPNPSVDLQGHYPTGSLLDNGRFAPFEAYSSSPEILDFLDTPASQENVVAAPVSNVNFDDLETDFHYLQTPFPPMVDLKAYDSAGATSTGYSQYKSPAFQFDSPTTVPRTSQHDFPLKLYYDHPKHRMNEGDSATEAPGRFGAYFGDFYVQ
ncbi:hypothetical protein F4803DRAFT_48407 [Xylaria telfairii]|nr:hypothetical protein F4803DRAFT_48407 [Xylaria telfairii]